jgi:hypothetical protein
MHSAFYLALAATILAAPQISAQGALPVRPDRQNVVASRLAGEWQVDSVLTSRLGGSRSVHPLAAAELMKICNSERNEVLRELAATWLRFHTDAGTASLRRR